MSAIDQLFDRLRASGQKAFMPFVTAGDPDLDSTIRLVRALADRGCHICEVGIPYSDPIADGPVIQASYARALEKGVTVEEIFAALEKLPSDLQMPLVTMVSYAIVHRVGIERYLDAAIKAGIAGLIVPDLPVEECDQLYKACSDRDVSLIQLVTPTTPRERALQIAGKSTGFLYYVSVTGITGERRQLPTDLTDNVAWLRERTHLPVCVGFGISQPAHVRLLAPVADGVIVGSALVRELAEPTRGADPVGSVAELAERLMEGLG